MQFFFKKKKIPPNSDPVGCVSFASCDIGKGVLNKWISGRVVGSYKSSLLDKDLFGKAFKKYIIYPPELSDYRVYSGEGRSSSVFNLV